MIRVGFGVGLGVGVMVETRVGGWCPVDTRVNVAIVGKGSG